MEEPDNLSRSCLARLNDCRGLLLLICTDATSTNGSAARLYTVQRLMHMISRMHLNAHTMLAPRTAGHRRS